MAATATRPPRQRRSGALDVLLTEAATKGSAGRVLQPPALARLALGVARRPDRVVKRTAGLGAELARVARGTCEIAPPKGDRRFADPAWKNNWAFRRMLQAYLAVGETVDGLVSDAGLDWAGERRARFALENVLDAVAPTNFPLTNPTVLKETIDRGGGNFVVGAARLARDARHRRLPAMVDTEKFEVGRNLAVTPGSVVLRTEVFELIQYAPATTRVRSLPVVIVPPTINKYYILDLAPGRSIVEHLVGEGQQVFMISWRNPDQGQGHFDFDTYARSIAEARDAVAEITNQERVHITAACSGGILAAGLLGHLAEEGGLDGVASLTLMVCALDNERAGTTAAMTSREVAAVAIARSARKGFLDGSALAEVFAWLRPNDLVWGYVVNNYLLGRELPAFDILYWNQDAVRLAAGLHRDFVHLALENSLTKPGALEVLGTGVDLSKVDVDSYVVAGLNDHIVPWSNAYTGGRLLGGRQRFVLSTSGHIQALVNPPGPESRSSYRVQEGELPDDPQEFLEATPRHQGSWWTDWSAWLGERSGETKPARKTLGSKAHPATAKAPGTYVLAQ
ncbi:MAG TPA: alpha/beta fold hydrolase [Baekduia sp.]|nr:alpha/beta fold hydrolase [Baekduia sp.]